MNPSQPFAHVSALDCPLHDTMHKRQFQPAPTSIFGDIRRRKLETGLVGIKGTFDSAYSQGFSFGSNSSASGQFVLGSQGHARNFNLTENVFSESRPKFKARPIPKSLYQPHKILNSTERPTTVPQEFPLSSSPMHKFVQPTRSSSFKARPMPNFTKSWAPQYSTPVKSSNPCPYPNQSNQDTSSFTPLPYTHKYDFPTPLKSGHGRSASGFEDSSIDSKKNKRKKKGEYEATVPMDIELHSSRRAQEREFFQEKLRGLQRAKEAQLKSENDLRLIQEKEELKNIRKQIEFRARPMPGFMRVIDWTKDQNIEDLSTDFTSSLNDTMMDIE